jgi:hypothetical protein
MRATGLKKFARHRNNTRLFRNCREPGDLNKNILWLFHFPSGAVISDRHAIVNKAVDNAPNGTESKAAFLRRFRKTAKTLPRGKVAKAIGHMKKQIQGVIAAKGYHPKSD